MNFTYEDYELYLEHVLGAVVIDMQGNIIYMNEQCAQYMKVGRDQSIGKKIVDIFPYTKMIEGLKYDKSRIVFYNTDIGIGISVQVPIYKKNKKIGLIEYDMVQGSEFLYDFVDEYRSFLDQQFKFLPRVITNLAETKYTINNIIGKSQQTIDLREQIAQAAHSNSTVLITGETGTGKELVAHSIHNLSNRRNNPFIRINASALPESLAESELFGYEEGSFTGAKKEGKKGIFELANTGTLFIDEINQMPINLQPKLLRALQEKEIDRIGGARSIPVDVRILTATNKDLRLLVAEGKFREDLYYRLNVVEIHTHPLRERMDDLAILTESIIFELNHVMGKRVTKVSPIVYEMFKSYDWPGNVRELHNVIERAMNCVEGDTLLSEYFVFKQVIYEKLGINTDKEKEANQTTQKELFQDISPIEKAKYNAERELLLKTLCECNNNKSQTAKALKISRPLLYQKLKRLKIDM
jgi:transcriptional regulator with PAS, ATPase and Fis domain